MKYFFISVFLLNILFVLIGSEIDEESADKWYTWAKFYFNLKKYKKSFQFAERALEINPYHEGAFLLINKIKKIIPNLKTKWERVKVPEIKTSNKRVRNWYFNGLERYFKGDYKRAFYCFKEAMRLGTNDPAVILMYYKTRFHIVLSDDAKANKRDLKEIYKKIKRENRHDKEASYYWFLMGKYYYSVLHDKARGLDCFEIAYALDNENKELIEFLNKINEEKKRLEMEKQKKWQEKLKKIEKEGEEKRKKEIKEREISTDISKIKVLDPKEELEKKKLEEEKQAFKEYKKTIDIPEIKSKKIKNVPEKEIKKTKKIDPLTKIQNEISKLLKESKEALKKGRKKIADKQLEIAFLKVLEYDERDLRANYYLMLLYNKYNKIEKACEKAVYLMYLINKYAYEDKKLEENVKHTLNCYLRSVLIQTAITAHNNREYEKMVRKNFNIRKLEKLGYISRKPKTLFLDMKTPDDKRIKVKWELPQWPLKDFLYNYFINQSGYVECKKHGLSPFLKNNSEIKEY